MTMSLSWLSSSQLSHHCGLMTTERVLETCSVIWHTRHDIFLKWYGSVRNTDPMKIISQLQIKYSIKLGYRRSSCKDHCRALPCAACPYGNQVCLLILCLSRISLIPVQKWHSAKKACFHYLVYLFEHKYAWGHFVLKMFLAPFLGSRKGGNIFCLFSSLSFFISIEIF